MRYSKRREVLLRVGTEAKFADLMVRLQPLSLT